MSGNRIKFEFTRALVRARKDWSARDRCGNYVTVALAVHNYSSGDGTSSYASAKRISADTGIPERTVERALKFLRDEALIHLDRRGGRGGDGSVWASEYSLRIPAKWSDAVESTVACPESRSAKETHQTDTTEPQYATSADQPVAQVTHHQSRYITTESSDPNTADPAPTESGRRQSSDGWVSVTPVDRFEHIPSMAAPEPDWDAMAVVGTSMWDDEPPF
jgi:DNA-binding transcriptional ArsR family regulator